MGFAIDIALCALAALFAWRLARKARQDDQLSVWLWACALAALGAGSMLGLLYRQFAYLIPGTSADLLWRLSLALHLAANALLLSGVIIAYSAGRIRVACLVVTGLKLASFLVYLGYMQNFDIVVYDSAMSALLLLALCTYGAWTWKYPYAQWIVAGAVVWLSGTLLHQGRVGPSQFLTPVDVFRVVEIMVLGLFVRGVWAMRDEPSSQGGIRSLSWRLKAKG